MSDISKALQGKLVRRKGRVNHADAQQLDLFASLSERAEKMCIRDRICSNAYS